MSKKIVGTVLLLFFVLGTVSVLAQSRRPRFQPNGQVLSRQKTAKILASKKCAYRSILRMTAQTQVSFLTTEWIG
jgi:hypothetical protein